MQSDVAVLQETQLGSAQITHPLVCGLMLKVIFAQTAQVLLLLQATQLAKLQRLHWPLNKVRPAVVVTHAVQTLG